MSDQPPPSNFVGFLNQIVFFLLTGGDANTQAFDKATPLYLAAQEDYPECIEVLLSHGANVNLETEDGLKPLHAAAHKGNVRSVGQADADYSLLLFLCIE